MAYVTQTEIQAKIPATVLNDALDDDGDGAADSGTLDQVISLAAQEVDGFLSGLFTVPFADPAPAKVRTAAFAFACEMIYQRRNVPADKNPYSAAAAWWRNHLQKVGNRELTLDAGTEPTNTPGAVVTEDSSVDDSMV